jgi:hypothetical protein
VYYLEGSPLNDVDLKRALAESSSAVFIMTNKFTAMPDEEDAKNILQSLSIHRYLEAEAESRNGLDFKYSDDPKTCCMQLIRPDNLRHLNGDDANMFNKEKSLVVCLNAIKMGVLAKALVFPGANILLMNLISTYSEDDMPPEEEQKEGESGSAKSGEKKIWMQ